MKLTPRGMYAIAVEEGIVPVRYLDKVGRPTCYIGHTASAGAPDPFDIPLDMPTGAALTRAISEAIRVFEATAPHYAEAVIDAFGVALLPHELDGLVNWHYNTGGAYSTSAAKVWKSGDKERAVRILGTWNKVTINKQKQISNTLIKRRALEAKIILKGEYPPLTPLPVWGTDGSGRVRWNAPVRTLNYTQFRAKLRLAAVKKSVGAATPNLKGAGITVAGAGLLASLYACSDTIGGALP